MTASLSLVLICESAAGQSAPVRSARDLLALSPAQIESVYRQGQATALPAGRVRGTVLMAPGTRRSAAMAAGARLVWQGKVIRPEEARAVNRFFGIRSVAGVLEVGPSWLDGAPSLVLDYEGTSWVYANYRDEIRQVGPGLWLGFMYDRTKRPYERVMMFALED
jgi:hypothetical protein